MIPILVLCPFLTLKGRETHFSCPLVTLRIRMLKHRETEVFTPNECMETTMGKKWVQTHPGFCGPSRGAPLMISCTGPHGQHTCGPRGQGSWEGGVCTCSIMSDSCDPIDCSSLGFSVHEILQARVLEWQCCHLLLQEIFPTQG